MSRKTTISRLYDNLATANSMLTEYSLQLQGSADTIREYQYKERNYLDNLEILKNKTKKQIEDTATYRSISIRYFKMLVSMTRAVMEDTKKLQDLGYVQTLKLKFSEGLRLTRHLGPTENSDFTETSGRSVDLEKTIEEFKSMYEELKTIETGLVDKLILKELAEYNKLIAPQSYTEYVKVINNILVLLKEQPGQLLSYMDYYSCAIPVATVIKERTGKQI